MASASHVLPRQKAGKMLSIMSAETEAFKTTNDRSQAHVGAHDCPLRVIDVGMWVQRTPTVNALIAMKLLDDDLELTEAGWAVLGRTARIGSETSKLALVVAQLQSRQCVYLPWTRKKERCWNKPLVAAARQLILVIVTRLQRS